MKQILIALFMLAVPVTAQAAGNVALTSAMFVERAVSQPDGSSRLVREQPKSVPPGAHLVFELSYRNRGAAPATDFVVTNRMPNGVAFEGTIDPGAVVSVDGGTSWSPLATAKVRTADGTLRPAQPDDVTHVRWTMKTPIPVGGSGTLTFRGTVK